MIHSLAFCLIITYIFKSLFGIVNYPFLSLLSVTVPLEKLKIMVPQNKKMPNKIIGHYYLGDNLHIKCKANGGHPLPQVSWWIEDKLVDSHSEKIFSHSVENKLVIKNLTRADSNITITCKGNNTILIPHQQQFVTVDMICKFINVYWLKLI